MSSVNCILMLLISICLLLQIASLTNEFYHLVPVGGFEYDAIRPIRDKKVLKEHFHLVSDLMDMEVASKILVGSQRKLTGMTAIVAWGFLDNKNETASCWAS